MHRKFIDKPAQLRDICKRVLSTEAGDENLAHQILNKKCKHRTWSSEKWQ